MDKTKPKYKHYKLKYDLGTIGAGTVIPVEVHSFAYEHMLANDIVWKETKEKEGINWLCLEDEENENN